MTQPYIVSCNNVYSRCHPPVEVKNRSDISKTILTSAKIFLYVTQKELMLTRENLFLWLGYKMHFILSFY